MALLNVDAYKGYGGLYCDEIEHNEKIYKIKNQFIKKVAEIYINNGWDIRVDKIKSIVYFHFGDAQISFHAFVKELPDTVLPIWCGRKFSFIPQNKLAEIKHLSELYETIETRMHSLDVKERERIICYIWSVINEYNLHGFDLQQFRNCKYKTQPLSDIIANDYTMKMYNEKLKNLKSKASQRKYETLCDERIKELKKERREALKQLPTLEYKAKMWEYIKAVYPYCRFYNDYNGRISDVYYDLHFDYNRGYTGAEYRNKYDKLAKILDNIETHVLSIRNEIFNKIISA